MEKKKMTLDDFLALIPEEDRERIDKLVDEKLKAMIAEQKAGS